MSDVDLSEFLKLSKPRRLQCGVKVALDALKPAERKQAQGAIGADRGLINHTAISRWFALRNQDVKADTVRRHRDKACSCSDD